MRNPLDLWRARTPSLFDSPLRDWASFQRNLENFFETPGGASLWSQMSSFKPAVDVEESDSSYLMTFDLPGMKKEDIKIDLHDNFLSVSGERREERKENAKGAQVYERAYGKFERSFTLPQAVAADRVVAEYKDGVLKVTLPKSEGARPKQIRVTDAKGGAL